MLLASHPARGSPIRRRNLPLRAGRPHWRRLVAARLRVGTLSLDERPGKFLH